MTKTSPVFLILSLLVVLFVLVGSPVAAEKPAPVMTRAEFDQWPYRPEYTVFNPFPSKGSNCTWYAHGRMIQLGYCKYALDSMRFNARDWAGDAARGAEVTQEPQKHSIAYWDGNAPFGSYLGHVGVVEAVMDDGSILVSDSSSSGAPYNTYTVGPGQNRWPTAFITVPPSRERSQAFFPGETVLTTAGNLHFRLEGANRSPVLVPYGTPALIKKHESSGIYSSHAGSTTSYHYWWYAKIDLGEETGYGWLAETYLELCEDHDLPPEGKDGDLDPENIEGDDRNEGDEGAKDEKNVEDIDDVKDEKDTESDKNIEDEKDAKDAGDEKEEKDVEDIDNEKNEKDTESEEDVEKEKDEGDAGDEKDEQDAKDEKDADHAEDTGDKPVDDTPADAENEPGDDQNRENDRESEPGSEAEDDSSEDPGNDQDEQGPDQGNESEDDSRAEEEKPFIAGDVSGNGRVDVHDVLLVMQHVLKLNSLDARQLKAADVNNDGVICVTDTVLLMQYSLGLLDALG